MKCQKTFLIGLKYCLDFFIHRSLSKSVENEREREEAVKLIRSMILTGDITNLIPPTMIQPIVSIVESNDERLYAVCVETLCELILHNPELASATNSFAILLRVLTEGPIELAQFSASALIFAFDSPSSRCFLRPSVDFEVLISVFTNYSNQPDAENEQECRLNQAVSILTKCFRSWIGFLYFCADDFRCIRSLVDILSQHSDTLRVSLTNFSCLSSNCLFQFLNAKLKISCLAGKKFSLPLYSVRLLIVVYWM